jgi:hypothetical protein
VRPAHEGIQRVLNGGANSVQEEKQ